MGHPLYTFLLSWIMHKFWEGHLPAVHLYDFHSTDNFIHQFYSLVSFPCSFNSQFGKLLSNPCWNIYWSNQEFSFIKSPYFAKEQLLLKGLYQLKHLDLFFSIIMQYKWLAVEVQPKGYEDRAEMYQICWHHWTED